jgi:hypothetical protein
LGIAFGGRLWGSPLEVAFEGRLRGSPLGVAFGGRLWGWPSGVAFRGRLRESPLAIVEIESTNLTCGLPWRCVPTIRPFRIHNDCMHGSVSCRCFPGGKFKAGAHFLHKEQFNSAAQ